LRLRRSNEEARRNEQHREDATLVLAELDVACHVV